MSFEERVNKLNVGQTSISKPAPDPTSGTVRLERLRGYEQKNRQKPADQQTSVPEKKSYQELLLPTPWKSQAQIQEAAERRNYAAQMQQRDREAAANSKPEEKTADKGTYRQQLRALAYTGNWMTDEERQKAVEDLKATKAELPTFGERLKKIVTGAGKQYLGSDVNAAATAYAAGQTGRNELYGETSAQYQKELEAAVQRQNYMKQHINDGKFTQEDVDAEQNYIDYFSMMLGAYDTGLAAQQGAVEETQKAVDTLAQSGTADIERASEGLGNVGQMAVQAGAAALQMGADAATGALTGLGSMAPMMVRSFGGGAQEARAKGYSQKQQIALGLTNAATEYFTEKLFGGNPVYDTDVGLVNKLVGKITSNETVMKALTSVPADMMSEGLEEVIADILEPAAEWAITGTKPEYELDQIIQDGAVGVLMSVVGLGGQAIGNAAQASNKGKQTADTMHLPTPEEYAARNAVNAAPTAEIQTGTEATTTETTAETQKTASTGEAVKAGDVTTIKKMYDGEKPVQNNFRQNDTNVSPESVNAARSKIEDAQKYANSNGGHFKTLLGNLLKATFTPAKNVPVNGMNFNGIQYTVDINKNVPEKVVSDKNLSAEKLALLDVLEDVVKNGRYVGSGQYEQHSGKMRPVIRYDYFETPVTINEKKYIAAFDVEVLPGANNYRTHKIENVDLIPQEASLAGPEPAASSTGLGPQISENMKAFTDDSVSQKTAESQERSEYEKLQLPKVPETEAAETSAPRTVEQLPTPEKYAEHKNQTTAERAAERQADIEETFREESLAEETARREAEEAEYRAEQRYRRDEQQGKQIESEGIAKTPKSRTALKTEIQKIFSIQEGMKRDVNLTVDGIADAYMKTGSIPESFLDQLFDAFYNRGAYTQQADQYYEEFRRTVKGAKIYVNDSVRAEFGDDWGAFVRRARAEGITLTSNPGDGGIDVHAAELAEIFPRTEAGKDLKAQLEDIVEMSKQGRPQQLSQEEMEAVIRGEWGDAAVEARMDEMKQKFLQAVEVFEASAQTEAEVRTNAEERIKKAQDRAQEIVRRQMERRALSEMQNKTLKSLQWLKKNRNRAPAELRARYDEVLKDIDTIAVGAANEMHIDNATGKTWRDLAQMYKDAKANDPNFLPSKELENIIMRLDGTKIADMDTGALQDLYKAASGLRTEFYNRNNVINDELGRTFAEAYDSSLDEIKAAKGIIKKSRADNFFNEQQLTPMNVLRRMAGWKDGTFTSFAKGLETGERNYKGYIVKAKEKLGKFLDTNREWVKTSDGQGKDAVWYEIEVPELLELGMGDKPIFGDTKTVYITPAQKVYMALEAQNYDNLRHMTGGRTFVNKELYSKGDRAAAYANGTTVKLAPETVKKIVSDLTPQEKALYDVLHDYFNGMAKTEINAVSNPLYGYDKAINSEYAPIYTNQNYVGHEAGKMDTTVEGVGALKARQYSKNPSYNISAFDAFDRHVDSTARFVGYAIPIRNMQTLMNWRGHNTTMRDTITHKWLDTGTRYVDDLMTDLQQSKINDKGFIDNEVGKLLSNYVSGVFGANPGIVFKQFMSYPQFASRLGWSTMPNAKQFAKVDTDLISKYTPELDYRLLGYATPEAAAMRQNKNGITETKVGGFIFGGGAITAMDGFTVARAWPWAENYVRKNFQGLEMGSAEQIANGESPFYRKVAEVYEDAVETTQPMYDTMHRANIMQNGNGIQRAFTMFKTVPLQQYNTLRRAFGELQQAKQSGTKAEQKTAAKTAANAVTATLTSAVGLELVELLNQLWKNGGKNYKDDDDELTAESILKRVGRNVFGDLAGISVLGKEASDFLGSKLFDDKWWGIEIPGGEQLNDVIDTISDAIDNAAKIVTDGFSILRNGGDLGEYFRVHGADYAGAVKDIAEKAAMYLGGLPAENVEKYLKGTIRAAAPEIYTAMEDAFNTPGKSDLKGLEEGQLEKRMTDVLKQTYPRIPEASIKELARMYVQDPAAVQSDVPTKITVNEEEVKLDAAAQQRYSEAMEMIAGPALRILDRGFYAGLDDEKKIKYLRASYRAAGDYAKREAVPEYSGDYTDQLDKMNDAGIGYHNGVKVLAAKSAGSRAEFIAWVRDNFDKAEQADIFEITNVSTKNYDTFEEYGLKAEDIIQVTDLLEELAAREKDPDKYRKAMELLDSDFTDDVKNGAVEALLTDKQRSGYSAAVHNGMERQYIRALEFQAGAKGVKDEAGNTIDGSKDLEVMREIDTYNLTGDQKKLLYTACGGKGETMWDTQYKGKDFEAYYYLSDSEREAYWAQVSAFLTATKYSEYITDFAGMHSQEYNGKTVKTKQDQVIEYIDGLDFTAQQKDALYLTQYSDSKLAKTPWHQSRYQSLLLPKP